MVRDSRSIFYGLFGPQTIVKRMNGRDLTLSPDGHEGMGRETLSDVGAACTRWLEKNEDGYEKGRTFNFGKGWRPKNKITNKTTNKTKIS